MTRRPWSDFTGVRSKSFVSDMMKAARDVPPDDLKEMESYRKEERSKACGGHDPVRTRVAYAQDELIYGANDNVIPVDRKTYDATPRQRRVCSGWLTGAVRH